MDSAIRRVEEKREYLSTDEETLALYKAREDSLHKRANMNRSAKEKGESKVRSKENWRQLKSFC